MKKYRIICICVALLSWNLSATAKKEINYLEIVRAYANEMIRNGQDHYGDEYSPLFATALRRDTTTLLPYPQFEPREKKSAPGDRWNFETYFLNIPRLGATRYGSGTNGNHGMEKAHKQTVCGDDPLDNLGVYKAFYGLSELTGDDTYRRQAEASLHWFYTNTQGPSGLYPWGEHLGWDFRHEYVTYHIRGHEDFALNPYSGNKSEPITEMYQSWEHETRGMYTEWAPFLGILAELPAAEDEFFTPLEKYSLGIWEQHFFDKKNGYYNRHGDYFGLKRSIEGTYGGDFMFPKYTGYFIDTWSLAYQHSQNEEFKSRIVECMRKLIEGNNKLHDKFGYRPFVVTGGDYDTRQCLQMAYQIIKAGQRLAKDNPELSKLALEYGQKELDYFCNYVKDDLSKYKSGDPETIYYTYTVTRDNRFLEYFRMISDTFITKGYNLLEINAGQAAKSIDCLIKAYKLFGDKKYLTEAKKLGEIAVKLYITPDSPLPKCVPADELITVKGEKWKTYYYSHLGSDDLMAAFIELAKITK